MNGGAKPKICDKGKGVKKKVSLSLDTVDESPPSSPRPPSKPRERRGAVDSMMRTGSESHHCNVCNRNHGKTVKLWTRWWEQVINLTIVSFTMWTMRTSWNSTQDSFSWSNSVLHHASQLFFCVFSGLISTNPLIFLSVFPFFQACLPGRNLILTREDLGWPLERSFPPLLQ